ncbi:MAG: hypothetical protein DMG21_01665 [Acidobacteria bacterium]|nr:MAG: hypothetical protein DMG21_01665 [Acidobacteriota bacterium]
MGACVIWDGIPFGGPVIPAKAGIHFEGVWKCAVGGLIPAFAAMTAVWAAHLWQMTSVPMRQRFRVPGF